ncbi:S8 family serine peptidase [Halostagnicola kamekurae]|uniref:Serine protease, subtilisin family n=1 Tax=Halostagnicola kamekurae TaxID=619731 RepID=A0A1I6PTD8_9EURY|nr:S8 family serine peptidase [Halostagnicola kamekurae]SFS43318.1 Serine protease, subtilisin family [Halostagnicola kamekurae]
MSRAVSGEDRRRNWRSIVVVVVLAASLAVASGPAAAAGISVPADGGNESKLSGTQPQRVDTAAPATDSNRPAIDPALENTTGTQSVVVEFGEVANQSIEDETAARRAAADSLQRPLETYANRTEGVSFEHGFWIDNAAVVTVDADRVEPSDAVASIAELDRVSRVRPEAEISVLQAGDEQSTDSDAAALASSTAGDVPYNLEQTNVSAVWEEFRTTGEGATIAVLDSGVDDDHPDIDLERWKDFTTDPSPEPTVYADHGTLVSGVATGGAERGTPIGVAPDAALLHGAVVADCADGTCRTSESAVLEGLEWAVEHEADAVSISLGWYRYSESFIDAVETANDAGTVVVGASGNRGNGSSLTPGNVYDALSVGATNESRGVASFSSGETIETDDAWGTDAPDDWPETYRTPGVVAPGVGIESAIPGDGYRTASGTSIAAPHVAGVVALVQSATAADLEASEIVESLRETATKPDDACTRSDDCETESDTRYGHGIVDAYAAIDALGTHATVDGTVTDRETGDPIPDATVALTAADGAEYETTTDADGGYDVTGLSGAQKYTVSIDADGYEGATETSDVPTDETTTIDSALAGSGTAEIRLTDAHFGTGIDTETVELVGDRGTYAATHVENGTYVAEHVPTLGEYDLRMTADGYEPESASLWLEADAESVTESYALYGNATLEVTAETGGGDPVENASLSIARGSGASFEPTERTDANGTLAVTVPGTGEHYTIEAKADGAGSGSAESATLESGERDSVTVVLSTRTLPTGGFGPVSAVIAMASLLGWTTMRRYRNCR